MTLASANRSPTNPEMDTLNNPHSGLSSSNMYPTNPYWGQPANPSETPQPDYSNSLPLEPTPANSEDSGCRMDDSFSTHLIDALVSAIEQAGHEQQDALCRQLSEWLPQLPGKLNPTMEQYLDKVVPKVIKVEHPGRTLLQLVRFLTVGMVVAGLVVGALLYAWLDTRQQRDTFASGYWQHRFIRAKASVDGSKTLLRALQKSDTLTISPSFMGELNRLENIVEARQQQFQLQQREQELIRSGTPNQLSK